jgi:hypothetical protein
MVEMASRRMVTGDIQLRSPWFSSQWRVIQNGAELAAIYRLGRIYVSAVKFDDGTRWTLEPYGAGVVRVVDAGGNEVARIIRRSWIGRRWDIVSTQFAYELVSDPRPRRWSIQVGGSKTADIKGSLVSYNRVDVRASIGLPLSALLLAWHVIARPWEAAAEPRGLVPVRVTRAQTARRGLA